MTENRTLEPATDDNLSEEGYFAANPDVKAAGFRARQHFERYGRAENRHQYAGYPTSKQVKYERFRKFLKSPYDDHPIRSFPIFVGNHHNDLKEYAQESANNAYSLWDHELGSNPEKHYLDLGCGYREHTFENCLYVEVYNSRSADLIVDPSCIYPIEDSVLDGIGCFAVLEHTRKPWLVVSEMRRMLKPGGKVFIDWPFLQPVHGYPSHFFNATREGLVSIFEDAGFVVESCKTEVNQTPAYTMHWILSAMAARLPDGALRREFLSMSIGDLIALDEQSETWWRFLNALDPAAFAELACGNFLIGTKRAT
ncbi:class I SAM-dependent methyltransferase [Methylobacterium brachiatum]|uniref:class I SAM-dependent methyltransferase n=1 Tax=Methylobacterium brachiatum TaxID=269660 RepID=UPI0013CE464C|nr:methyltransferase domain-containing protein [Methylobacterium brachiatum]